MEKSVEVPVFKETVKVVTVEVIKEVPIETIEIKEVEKIVEKQTVVVEKEI